MLKYDIVSVGVSAHKCDEVLFCAIYKLILNDIFLMKDLQRKKCSSEIFIRCIDVLFSQGCRYLI